MLLINPKEYKHSSPRECQNALLPKRILKKQKYHQSRDIRNCAAFTQLLEMLISCRSLDCIWGWTTCKSIERTTVINKAFYCVFTQWFLMVLCSLLPLKKAFVLSWLGGTSLFWWTVHNCPDPWWLERRQSWCGGSVVFHKRDGRQLLTELF